MHKLLFKALLAVMPLALCATASATPVTGTLELNGTVRVTSNTIDWFPVGGTTGTAIVAPSSTGTFSALVGQTVTEKDLSQASFPTSGFAPLDGFETVGTIDFVLQDILSCAELGPNYTCAAGPTSPFGFTTTPTGVTVQMAMTGIVFDGSAATGFSTWQGLFTAPFSGETIASLLAQLTSPGFIDSPFSASKITATAAVPEPASLLLLGTGLFGTAMRARKRRNA